MFGFLVFVVCDYFNCWKCCLCIFCSGKMHLGMKCPGQREQVRLQLQRGLQTVVTNTVYLWLYWTQTKRENRCGIATPSVEASTYGSPLIHVVFSPHTVFSCNRRSPDGTELGGTPVHIHRCRWVGDAVNSPVDEWPPCPCTATLLMMLCPSAAFRLLCCMCQLFVVWWCWTRNCAFK